MSAVDEHKLGELLAKSQDGDSVAYNQFLEEAYKVVKDLVTYKTTYNTEDAIQDILISIHRARHSYDPSRPVIPWIRAIAKFRLADLKRAYWREQKRKEAAAEQVVLNESESAEMLVNLRDAVGSLSQTQRDVISLLKEGGYSLDETASQLGLTVSSVKNHASRAYAALRRILMEEPNDS